MSDRPIIMTGESVRAILAGRKTMTRRVITLRQFGRSDTPGYDWTFRDKRGLWNDFTDATLLAFPRRSWVPYRTGDLLWVKEAWCVAFDDHDMRIDPPKALYRADGVEVVHVDDHMRSPWVSPLFMPRWASRLSLRVTSVRVERLQDISAEDARAEGIEVPRCACEPCSMTSAICPADASSYIESYAAAWDAINGKRAPWASNPYVWAISFEVVQP